MRKVLGCEEITFRSEEQREALRVIVSGEQNPAALVFVGADFVAEGQFLGYAQLLSVRVFSGECS
jgi:hypothetical protein